MHRPHPRGAPTPPPKDNAIWRYTHRRPNLILKNQAFLSNGESQIPTQPPRFASSSPQRAYKAGAHVEESVETKSPLLDDDGGGTKNGRKAIPLGWERYQSLVADTWFPEIFSWIFSLACLVAVICILWHYDGKPLPRFPYRITIGTIVALFSTLSATALMVPVEQGISQLKWFYFSKQGRKAIDFERYDQASRGAWGSMRLICSSARGKTSIIGGVIAILVLAANTITQQAVNYVPQKVWDPHRSAVVPVTTHFNLTAVSAEASFVMGTGALPKPDYQMQGATMAGIFNVNSSVAFTHPHCSTGNCTWADYRTLAICSSTSDVSDLLALKKTKVPFYGQMVTDYFAIIDGVTKFVWQNATSIVVLRSTGTYHSHWPTGGDPGYGVDVKSKRFGHLENTTVADYFVIWYQAFGAEEKLQAVEINLHYCVQKLHSYVHNGDIVTTERVQDRITDFEFPDDLHGFNLNKVYGTADSRPHLMMTATAPDTHERFAVSRVAQQSLLYYTRSLFNGSWFFVPDGNGPVNASWAGTALAPTSQLVWTWTNSTAGLEAFADNLAMKLSNRLREQDASNRVIVGKAYSVVTYIRISWAWISLLAALVAGSLLFLLLVMAQNRSHKIRLWRASNLALMQALDVERPLKMMGIRSNLAMEKHAKHVDVRLQRDTSGVWKLS